MSESQSKAAVRLVDAPVAEPEIQLELTKRSAYGLLAAGVALGFLIFLTGLVVGVSVNLESTSTPATAAASVEVTAPLEQPVLAMETGAMAVPDTVAAVAGSALPLTGFDSAGPAADLPRPELGAVLTAPSPTAAGATGPEATPAAATARPAPAPAPPPAARGSAPTFHLQAGAFRAAENADNLKARLVERGYPARVRVTEGSSGQPLFRVLLGEYPTEATAQSAAEDFRSQMGQEAYVMTSRELGP